jgi:hypothetical protein
MNKPVVSRKLRAGPVAVAAAGILLVTAAPAMAAGSAEPAPIAANQFFVGVVNGQTGASRVAVTCDGPIDFVPTGHPVAGQFVEVQQVFATERAAAAGGLVGSTGSAATTIGVRLGSLDPETRPIVLKAYQSAVRIPTDILVPCEGDRTVSFEPNETSPTARPATVTVTFVKA